MAKMVILVLDDPNQCDELLESWMKAGVGGVTILHSTGLMRRLGKRTLLGDDMPLFPSLENLLRSREEHHRTLWTVVGDDFNMDGLVAATEAAIGSLQNPNTGILFTLPVLDVWGLDKNL